LIHQRSGRAYCYRSLLSREQATRNQVQDVVARFFDGRAEQLIATLLKNDMIKPNQLVGITKSLVPAEGIQVA
jgi:predicted transcriptional regulator